MSVAHSDQERDQLRHAVDAGDRATVSTILSRHPRRPSFLIAALIWIVVWTMGLVADQVVCALAHDSALIVFMSMIVFIVGGAALGVLSSWTYWHWRR